jgi:hypothetical protein
MHLGKACGGREDVWASKGLWGGVPAGTAAGKGGCTYIAV